MANEDLTSTGLGVRASPGSRRRTERLPEGTGKCGLGIVAYNLGNLREGDAAVAQLLSCDLHAPIGEIMHRRDATILASDPSC